MNKHLAFESILPDWQHGFQSQRSRETQLVQFYHDMVSNLDRALNGGQRQTDMIIMDLAKAFDKVLHRRLLYKLDYCGSAHGSLSAIKNGVGWPSFRSCPGPIQCPPRIGVRSGPFSDFY